MQALTHTHTIQVPRGVNTATLVVELQADTMNANPGIHPASQNFLPTSQCTSAKDDLMLSRRNPWHLSREQPDEVGGRLASQKK